MRDKPMYTDPEYTTPVTVEQRLAEMRDRSEKATHGPWGTDRVFWKMRGERRHGWWREVTDEFGTIALLSEQDDSPETGTAEATSEFIAHARTDLDDLRGAIEDVLALADELDANAERYLTGATEYNDGAAAEAAHCARLFRAAITARLGGA